MTRQSLGRWYHLAASPPHLARGLDDQRELAALVLDGERVAGEIAGEAALRAQTQALERHAARRFVDAALEGVLGLKLRRLGRDEAEHDRLSGRQVAQRPEVPGARRVVFHEEVGNSELLEHAFAHA